MEAFIEKLTLIADEIHQPLLKDYPNSIVEVRCYFLDSFGSYGRLDYGTGHELNFMCWLICFLRL